MVRAMAGRWKWEYLTYPLYLLAVIVVLDLVVFRWWRGHGLPEHFEEQLQRMPRPYVEFSGTPNQLGHNELGFPGPSPASAGPGDLKLALFGGSTAYHSGIQEALQAELNRLLPRRVFVGNFAVVSSNHRQHLHALLEYFPKAAPDVVIFYGGYNETVQSAFYDPRPGYPYNFYYRAETTAFVKVLLEHSALLGSLEMRFGWFSGIAKLREAEQPLSASWNHRVVADYFAVLEQARRVTSTYPSTHCGHTRFVAFYQPFRVPDQFVSSHRELKRRIAALEYAFDVSDVVSPKEEPWHRDGVHLRQRANERVGAAMAKLIQRQLVSRDGCQLE